MSLGANWSGQRLPASRRDEGLCGPKETWHLSALAQWTALAAGLAGGTQGLLARTQLSFAPSPQPHLRKGAELLARRRESGRESRPLPCPRRGPEGPGMLLISSSKFNQADENSYYFNIFRKEFKVDFVPQCIFLQHEVRPF